MPSFFDRFIFSDIGDSFRCLTTTDGLADGNQLSLVTRAIHVSRIIPTWTLVNPNHVGPSDAGEGIKKPESGLSHQKAYAQRRAAILLKYKRRRRNFWGRCWYVLNLSVSVLDWTLTVLTIYEKVTFFDEAHKLWVDPAQDFFTLFLLIIYDASLALIQSTETMKCLVDSKLVLTKQDRLYHVIRATSDPFY